MVLTSRLLEPLLFNLRCLTDLPETYRNQLVNCLGYKLRRHYRQPDAIPDVLEVLCRLKQMIERRSDLDKEALGLAVGYLAELIAQLEGQPISATPAALAS